MAQPVRALQPRRPGLLLVHLPLGRVVAPARDQRAAPRQTARRVERGPLPIVPGLRVRLAPRLGRLDTLGDFPVARADSLEKPHGGRLAVQLD